MLGNRFSPKIRRKYNSGRIFNLTKHLTMEFRENYPQVEWKSAARFRDIVAHKYETLNMLDVYETVIKDFPEMKLHIEKILEL